MADLLERLSSALGDRYAIQSEIGRGGMATVFLAEDLKHDRRVAIKVLHPELSVTLAAERFLSEIKIVAGLNHPHILTLHDSGEADGLLYYVMPYVSGESLRQRLEREGQLPVEESVRIAVEVADGLQHAHEQGVIHRDVKPGNILLSGKHAVITDFGIARAITVAQGGRVTSTGLGVGTPLYASPEQVMGAETLDGRTDVYSLGCVLYEMLAGQVPLAATTPQAVQARRMSETPGPIHELRDTVPPLLDQVVAKALTRLPADRWDSAETFAQALLTATMDATPVARLDLATTPGLEAIAEEAPKRRPLRWAIGAAVVALAAIGVWLVVPRVASLTGSKEQAAPAVADAGPAETKIPLEGRFGDFLGWGTGPFAISPDGEQLAYCSYDREAQAARLWLAGLSDLETDHRVLAASDNDICRWVHWAPNGDRIFFDGFVQGRYDYYVVPIAGGYAPTRFSDCSFMDGSGKDVLDPRWALLSPDESRTVHRLDYGGLRIVLTGSCDFATGDSVGVESNLLPLAWSPRGDRLLFRDLEMGDSLWTTRTDGGDRRNLGTNLGIPQWPRLDDAIWFAFDGAVMRLPVSEKGEPKGEPEMVFGSPESPVRVRRFSVSADGRRMVIARRNNQFRLVRVGSSARDDLSEPSVVAVTETLPGWGAFGVSHDGLWVAYSQLMDVGADLFKVRLERGTPIRLTRNGMASGSRRQAWSPDDQRIAYYGIWQDSLALLMLTADGRSTGPVLDVRPSPESSALSWESLGLFHMRYDYRAEALTDLEVEYGQWRGSEWAPAPAGSAPGASFITRARRDLVFDTLAVPSSDRALASPDGSRIVARVNLRDLGEYWVLTSSDSVLSPLAPALGEDVIGWSGDGRSLYWQQGSDLYRGDIDGGDKELLLTLPTLPDGQVWQSPCQPRRGVEPLEFVCKIDESVTELFLVDLSAGGA